MISETKKKLDKFISKYKPTIIFHLAAQPLIIESYLKPHKTIDVNVGGTLNILEASRNFKFIKSVVMITSDKCYENVGKLTRYKENDILGGIDPYSASKSSSELIIRAYRESFFRNKRICGISSARAGNVIGGGDWSTNRLIPDGIRSLLSGKSIYLRNPKFNRPWQHVLEPLSGYLTLAMNLSKKKNLNGHAFNFGPKSNQNEKVISLINKINKSSKLFSKNKIKITDGKLYESGLLKLNCSKAKKLLLWEANLNLYELINFISEWYICYHKKRKELLEFSINQIKNFEKIAKNNKIYWSN